MREPSRAERLLLRLRFRFAMLLHRIAFTIEHPRE
jgi:hypothetical protein